MAAATTVITYTNVTTQASVLTPPAAVPPSSSSPPSSSPPLALYLDLQDGDVIMGEPFALYGDDISMVARFLYFNGSKRFLQLLHNNHNSSINVNTINTDDHDITATTNNNTSTATTTTSSTSTATIVRIIPQSLLHAIPTRQWHVTVDHMESIATA